MYIPDDGEAREYNLLNRSISCLEACAGELRGDGTTEWTDLDCEVHDLIEDLRSQKKEKDG